MIVDVLATAMSIAVVFGLGAALYGWFSLSLRRFHGVVARDVLNRWDAQVAELSERDREHVRAHPPTEVLDAILALPARRPRRFQLS
jgi:hypothetical protein